MDVGDLQLEDLGAIAHMGRVHPQHSHLGAFIGYDARGVGAGHGYAGAGAYGAGPGDYRVATSASGGVTLGSDPMYVGSAYGMAMGNHAMGATGR
jgi:hypothetical protein